MSDSDDMTPAGRARIRLLGLIEQSECAQSAFNPWPLAELDARLPDLTSQPSARVATKLKGWSKLQKKYTAADAAWSGPIIRRPLLQRQAAQRCIDLKHSIEDGDGFAVVEAVAACAAHGLVIPAWLASAFVLRYQRVATGECRSWGDEQAFGSALEKGANVAGLKAKMQTAPWAYEVATRLLGERPSRPIDRALFEDVGAEIGAGQTKVQALIVEYLKRSDGLHPPLVYVRDSLNSGLALSSVHAKWEDEQFEAVLSSIGFAPGADGVWRNSNEPE
jgi:hypothetical protein